MNDMTLVFPEFIPDFAIDLVRGDPEAARVWNTFILVVRNKLHSLGIAIDANEANRFAESISGLETTKESILEEAQRIINGPRAESYGPPEKNFAEIAYGWENILDTKVSPEQVALCMIWLKIKRFQNGKPDRDSIVDIAGYAGTIEKLLGGRLK